MPHAIKNGQDTNSKEEFLRQFQEMLLVSDNLELDIGDSLMKIYESLDSFEEKLGFVMNMKLSVSHPQVLSNLSGLNHKFLLENSLKLCISVS